MTNRGRHHHLRNQFVIALGLYTTIPINLDYYLLKKVDNVDALIIPLDLNRSFVVLHHVKS
jgi:hypothetical protein